MIESYLTTRQAAAALGVSPRAIPVYVARGLLVPALRLPRALLFTPAEVERYRRERTPPGRHRPAQQPPHEPA